MLDRPLLGAFSQAGRGGKGQPPSRAHIQAGSEAATRRTLVLHGLHPAQLQALTSAYGAAATRLPCCTFALASPRNTHRSLRALLTEWAHDYDAAVARSKFP